MRIQDALDVSKNVVNNFVMRAMVETSINNILVGTSWIEPFEKAGLGSTMITEMLKVGMQTDLSAMMEKLLEYMDVDIKNTMDNSCFQQQEYKTFAQWGRPILGEFFCIF